MMRTDWRDHDWQLIHTAPQSPTLHMALDDVLVDEVGAGRRGPTLRIWEWAGPAVVRDALGADVMMYGISPQAIAVAVRRALHEESAA